MVAQTPVSTVCANGRAGWVSTVSVKYSRVLSVQSHKCDVLLTCPLPHVLADEGLGSIPLAAGIQVQNQAGIRTSEPVRSEERGEGIRQLRMLLAW